MPGLLIRAIITGFGYKVGAELGRMFAERVGLKKPEPESKNADDGYPAGMQSEDEDTGDPETDDV